MTHRVVFSERAEDQLNAPSAAIEWASGRARAESLTGAVVAFCMGLSLFPERGTRRDDLRPGLRILGWRRVTIALTVEPDVVVIFGSFHGGQDWAGAFAAQARPALQSIS